VGNAVRHEQHCLPDNIQAWNKLTDEEKRYQIQFMTVHTTWSTEWIRTSGDLLPGCRKMGNRDFISFG